MHTLFRSIVAGIRLLKRDSDIDALSLKHTLMQVVHNNEEDFAPEHRSTPREQEEIVRGEGAEPESSAPLNCNNDEPEEEVPYDQAGMEALIKRLVNDLNQKEKSISGNEVS